MKHLRDEILQNHCKKVLKRIAWRLQYATKNRLNRETAMHENVFSGDTTSNIVSDIYVQQLLMQLPKRAQFIIKSIIIDGFTEEEVANKLKISRQGVSKCKNKYLNVLAKKLNHSA